MTVGAHKMLERMTREMMAGGGGGDAELRRAVEASAREQEAREQLELQRALEASTIGTARAAARAPARPAGRFR